jgi:hypothetical protein
LTEPLDLIGWHGAASSSTALVLAGSASGLPLLAVDVGALWVAAILVLPVVIGIPYPVRWAR